MFQWMLLDDMDENTDINDAIIKNTINNSKLQPVVPLIKVGTFSRVLLCVNLGVTTGSVPSLRGREN